MPGPELTVSELINRIQMRRGDLDDLVATFPQAWLENPGSTGWSVKDHLAHLTAWRMSLLALLNGGDRAEAMGIHLQPGQPHDDTDTLNQLLLERSRTTPFSTVQHDYKRSHQLLHDRLSAMTDADLQLPYSHYQPNDPPHNPDPVIGWILGNTIEHDDEHIPLLRALKKELSETEA